MAKKYVYFFGGGKADGNSEMKELLGGKGANLAEMTNLGIPVPAGFTITTEMCTDYYANKGRLPKELEAQVDRALAGVEKIMGAEFGDPENPLLVSVRSGARKSMPGMMETVLNIGLTTKTLPALAAKTGNERFAYDAYRRLIMMYADVVMEKAAGVEPKDGHGIRHLLEVEMDRVKEKRGYSSDTELSADELKALCELFKAKIKTVLGKPFPDDPRQQLWGGVKAVFQSWNGKRAIAYRRIEGIPGEWGTAVNVQSMVFGNMGDSSATGVAFTRDPATGDHRFYGEFLVNAQGEDVVAGIRTPGPLSKSDKTADTKNVRSLEELMPKAYKQLFGIQKRLETHYSDMQDIEFTIQDGRLWLLQTRVGKRNGPAAVKMAVDMAREKLISKEEAIMRVRPSQLDELLHPMVDPKSVRTIVAKGLPASPGGAQGKVVFTADEAETMGEAGEKVILVRHETSPEDVHGMHAAEGILTAKGGMTSHAALVARGWGKCCVVGCSAIHIDYSSKKMTVNGRTYKQGDWITLDGTRGEVLDGKVALVFPNLERNKEYVTLMTWADEIRSLGVRTNADRPQDAKQARDYGAGGIGLCRTEHMFFEPERIMAIREMIVAETPEARRKAVFKLLPYQKKDFYEIFKAMEGLPVTIRLLDPPLHEFVPHEDAQIKELASSLGVQVAGLKARIAQLHELNPMLGHRGCRLGITYPEISEMQARAIFEAAAELIKKGKKVYPEVMVPLVGTVEEFRNQRTVIDAAAKEVMAKYKVRIPYKVGTMIEIPRAALVADRIAEEAEFFSFGTNDLTQTTFGFSRDDVGSFLPVYLAEKILKADPFQTLDIGGVGQLVRMGVERGRSARPGLKVGICGEHGGDPDSITFCHQVGMDYVSCSPFRVPIARLAAARVAVEEKRAKKTAGARKGKRAGKGASGKARRR